MAAKTTWKFTAAPDCVLEMPKGAKSLSVHEQGDYVCLWALVDPDAEVEQRRFRVFGTGFILPEEPMSFVGTAHLKAGRLVLHVFEVHAAEPRQEGA